MKLVFATHNKNKFTEVQALMPPGIQLLSLTDINCHDDIPETESTIEGNAKLKSNYVRDRYGLNCFADDTGLEVHSLNGAPGVYSARYAGPNCDADDNMDKLLANLEDKQDRGAQFKTAISLSLNGSEELFLGICKGAIITEKKGEKGFGYDPVFTPIGYEKTFAEISSTEKGEIGHRGKAIRKLIGYLNELHFS